jgi:hypothetical protein
LKRLANKGSDDKSTTAPALFRGRGEAGGQQACGFPEQTCSLLERKGADQLEGDAFLCGSVWKSAGPQPRTIEEALNARLQLGFVPAHLAQG